SGYSWLSKKWKSFTGFLKDAMVTVTDDWLGSCSSSQGDCGVTVGTTITYGSHNQGYDSANNQNINQYNNGQMTIQPYIGFGGSKNYYFVNYSYQNGGLDINSFGYGLSSYGGAGSGIIKLSPQNTIDAGYLFGQLSFIQNSLTTLINPETGIAIQSMIDYSRKNNLSPEETQQLIKSVSQPSSRQGQDYIMGWAFGSSALALAVAAPELTAWSLGSGAVLGGGLGGLTYLNTNSQVDYNKLAIYTGGGAVTGALTAATKNPALMWVYGSAGAYTTQYAAEGKANMTSAAVSGAFGPVGNALGKAGASLYVQTLLTYPPSAATTTMIDKIIEKKEKGKK
ncbi:hypothetical protein WBV54_18045, partial [Acinetobacter baumannii]